MYLRGLGPVQDVFGRAKRVLRLLPSILPFQHIASDEHVPPAAHEPPGKPECQKRRLGSYSQTRRPSTLLPCWATGRCSSLRPRKVLAAACVPTLAILHPPFGRQVWAICDWLRGLRLWTRAGRGADAGRSRRWAPRRGPRRLAVRSSALHVPTDAWPEGGRCEPRAGTSSSRQLAANGGLVHCGAGQVRTQRRNSCQKKPPPSPTCACLLSARGRRQGCPVVLAKRTPRPGRIRAALSP